MALDENIGRKHPGDPIKSDDWNQLAEETRRLDAQKLDLGGGTVSGPLTVMGTLTSPTLGVQILHGDEDTWTFTTDKPDYQAALARNVTFASATSLLVAGHCSAQTTPKNGLQMVLSVDGAQLHQVNANSALSWGMATYWGVSPGDVSQPLVTMGVCTVAAGAHDFRLLIRSTTAGQPVQVRGATLFLLQVGAGSPT
ncbi:hypothetical protein [Microbispora sp. NPDC049125]|uniref:hypothetical protein n=1 Tax=Microbispora sp. NPDC049125 TaxID=3154929 RepID=UPI003466ABE2